MIGARYVCCDEGRRAALVAEGPPGVSGIDYVEVRRGATVADPSEIDVVLVEPLPLPGAALSADNLVLTGGSRHPPPTLAHTVTASPGGAQVSRYTVTVPGGQQIEPATYRLTIVAAPGSTSAPAFLDPRLSSVELSFTVDCGGDGDCAAGGAALPTVPPPEPAFDNLARDWDGLRRLMLDQLAVLVPGFGPDDPVDLTTTIVEALAYRADQQSYTIDRISTEAFLDTAHARASITRHARLLDYVPAEGSCARTFVRLSFAPDGAHPDGFTLPAATPVLPRTAGLPPAVPAARYAAALAASPVVFETLAVLRLWGWRSEIALHTWRDEQCTLPAGSTAVTLVDTGGGAGPLAVGDLLALVQTRAPDTGRAEDADPGRRQVVRLTAVTTVTDILAPPGTRLVDVEWDAADALPFDLVVSAQVPQPSGPAQPVVCAVAHANVVLAEHGASLPPPEHLGLPPSATAVLAPRLSPPTAPAAGAWHPRVVGGTAVPARVPPADPAATAGSPATAQLEVNAQRCLAALTLQDSFASWAVRRDLLASDRFSRDVVVETAPDGHAVLRFGDGVHGLPPTPGQPLTVSGRFGDGAQGNLGHDALGHVVLRDGDAGAGVTAVANPLPAKGGTGPEPDAAIRVAAPQAFRSSRRAVTAEDYADAARAYSGVAGAVAVARWTGAWQTVVVHVDRTGGLRLDRAFTAGLLEHLESFRLAGFDVAVREARAVALDVALKVCAEPGALRTEVGRRVRAALSPFGDGGVPGFFHPDRFTFGTPLYLSALLAAVTAVPGVQSVIALTFQRLGRLPGRELQDGVIRPTGQEVLELRDDPAAPDRGRLRVTTGGGR